MIKVDYEKLPIQFNVIRGHSVTHIIEYRKEDVNKESDFIKGYYLCDQVSEMNVINSERFYQPNFIANISEEFLTCRKCEKHYSRIIENKQLTSRWYK